MVADTVAPWAEPVLFTVDDLAALPDDAWHYELVEGRLVRLSPTGWKHGRIVTTLILALGPFAEKRCLGQVIPAETGFVISPAGGPDTVLAPDLAFVCAGREPDPGTDSYPRLAPDLVVEVASPSQSRSEVGAKAQRWLSGGVRLVWIVLPKTRSVEVWRSGDLDRVVTAEEELSGEDVLPGFTLPVRRLFS